MSAPNLGPGAPIDLARLVETRLLVQANSGAGKSWCLRRLLEQTHGSVQQIVIDPEGEFFTLREAFDYVLVARHGGDAVADPKLAGLLATRLLELEASAILDISELEARDRVRFVRLFLERLIQAPRALWHPALIVLDEAHAYAPQKGECESARAVIDLCVRGRKRGFAACLATQRLAKLSKDAAAELLNKLVGRTGLDVDAARAAEELGMGTRDDRLSLRALQPGQFFAYGPALSVEVRRIEVGPVKTTHPRAGARIGRGAPPPPTEKIRKLLPKIADLAREEVEEAAEIERLRAEIRSLRGKLSGVPAVPAVPVGPGKREILSVSRELVREVRNTIDAQRLEQLNLGRQLEMGLSTALEGAAARLEALVGEPLAARLLVEGKRMPCVTVPVVEQAPGANRRAPGAADEHRATESGLSGPELRVLDALAWLEVLGEMAPDRRQVAAVARYSPKSGGFRNLLSLLRSGGLIDYGHSPPGSILLTQAGRGRARYPTGTPTGERLREMALEILGQPERRLLEPLCTAFPHELSREDLAEAAGYAVTSGGFRNLLSKLRTLGFIDYRPAGRIVADPILFPDTALRGGTT